LEKMRARGIGDRLLTGGGIIPPEDMETLASQGVGRLFGPGTSTRDIAAYIHEWCARKYGDLAPLREPPDSRATSTVTAAGVAHHAPRASSPRPAAPSPAKSRAKPAANSKSVAKRTAPKPVA